MFLKSNFFSKVDIGDKQLSLGNFVFDEENHERKSWTFFKRTCNRSLLVFMCQFFFHSFNTSMCINSNKVIHYM